MTEYLQTDRPVRAGAGPEPERASGSIRPESAAAYIADIATELAGLARGANLEILAYLLDIAQLEAATTSRRLARETCAR